MNMRHLLSVGVVACMLATDVSALEVGQEEVLPAPAKTGGLPLMDALQQRQSGREYAAKPIEREVLSALLWAAQGVNREDGRKTSPTARNAQEIELYVVLEDATYLYLPSKHALKLVLKGDLRVATGMQPFVGTAPLNLVMVVNMDKFKEKGIVGERAVPLAHCDCGFISQNVYLYCASAGLSTVVRGLIDPKLMGEKLKLPATHIVLYGQSVGYPEKKQ